MPLRSEAPIVTVTINGIWNMLEEKDRIQPAMISLIIHEPMITNGMSQEDIIALPKKVKYIIEADLVTSTTGIC